MINKKLTVSLATFAIIGSLAYGASTTQAFFGQSDSDVFSKLAQRLGKSEDEVTQVMQELHQEKKERVQIGFESHLDQAEENGELSAEQKQLILEKKEQFRSECDGSGSRIQEHREELISWAQENGIDPSFLMGMGQGNGRRMMQKNQSVGGGRYRQSN